MSALPNYPREDVGTSHAGLRMTVAEYLSLGETPNRYELVNGVVFMSPSPSSKHQRIVRRLLAQLDAACDRLAGLEALGDYDIALAPGLVYQPDICVFAPGRFEETADHTIVPDLAIEVLSPSSKAYDLVTKRQDYERFGVREYWVIDQDDASVRRWVREGNAFVERPVEGTRVDSAAIPGLTIDLSSIR